MEFIVHIFKLYPNLISDLVQGVVYIGSTLLFLNALWLIVLAYRHARLIKENELMALAADPATLDDPLMTAAVKTLRSAHDEHKATAYPVSFLIDATHQMRENTYHTRYINKITMITNLLPPMGFIGTIFGMIMIFLAKGDPNSDLNTTGLGVALFTTLIALTCFVILEVFKKSLINLATSRIERALGYHQSICEMTAPATEDAPLSADAATTP